MTDATKPMTVDQALTIMIPFAQAIVVLANAVDTGIPPVIVPPPVEPPANGGGDPPVTHAASPDGFRVPDDGMVIYDDQNNSWSISADAKIVRDFVSVPSSSEVVQLYWNAKKKRLEQLNRSGRWYTQPVDGSAGVDITDEVIADENPGQGVPPVITPPTGNIPTIIVFQGANYGFGPDSPTAVAAGHSPNGKIYKNDVADDFSHDATDIFTVKNADGSLTLWQKVVNPFVFTTDGGVYYYRYDQNDQGQARDPRTPISIPPIPTSGALPENFQTFAGMTTIPNRWELPNNLTPSTHNPGDTPNMNYDPLLANVDSLGNLILQITSRGCAEVAMPERFRARKAIWEVYGRADIRPGRCNALNWIYSDYNGNGNGGDNSEDDDEGNTKDGGWAARGHHERQNGNETYLDVGPWSGAAVILRKDWDIDAGTVESFINGISFSKHNREEMAAKGQPFIDQPMKPYFSFRPTGWLLNGVIMDGWCGTWDGTPGVMPVYGYKFTMLG